MARPGRESQSMSSRPPPPTSLAPRSFFKTLGTFSRLLATHCLIPRCGRHGPRGCYVFPLKQSNKRGFLALSKRPRSVGLFRVQMGAKTRPKINVLIAPLASGL